MALLISYTYRMNLRQLQHVVALAEHRNFRRAADSVGLTQSALTQSIRNLEEEYGVELFERSRREVSPTAWPAQLTRSITMAMPWPPPMHMVSNP
jgi:DNA-binding transcriptional LysR family regulator